MEQSGERSARSWRARVASAVAVVAWLVLSWASVDFGHDRGPELVGALIAAPLLPLALGLAVRLLLVKVVWRRESLPFWSPMVFAIAAGFALLILLNTARDRARESDQRDVVACIRTGVEHFGQLPSARSAALREAGLTEQKTRVLMERVCTRVQEEGLLREDDVQFSDLEPIVEEVVAEMQANGGLP